jgi:hypothetical protein
VATPAPEPFWAAPALLAALIAALGFLGKTATDLILSLNQVARDRRSRLVELYALIRAGDAAFAAQRDLRLRLAQLLKQRLAGSVDLPQAHERLFAATFAVMEEEERQLHALIRSITVHTFYPLNQALLAWLRSDLYFRAASPQNRTLGELAVYLARLEAHLILWIAKYEAWIPEHPEHALVYLADEDQHGIAFPKGGAQRLARILGHPPPPVRRRARTKRPLALPRVPQ